MSYRVSPRGACQCGSIALPIPWWKKPFRWLVAWLQVRREAAAIEALRDQEREFYMLGGLVLVREMRELRMSTREMQDDLRAQRIPSPIQKPGPGRVRFG